MIRSLCAADSLSMLENYNGTSLTAVISPDLSDDAASRRCESCNIHQRCLPSTSLCILRCPPVYLSRQALGMQASLQAFQRVLWQTRPVCSLWNLSGLEFCTVCFTLLAVKAEGQGLSCPLGLGDLWFPSSQVCSLFRVGEPRPVHPYTPY